MEKDKPLKEKFIVTSLKENSNLLGYFYLECDVKEAVEKLKEQFDDEQAIIIIDSIFGRFE